MAASQSESGRVNPSMLCGNSHHAYQGLVLGGCLLKAVYKDVDLPVIRHVPLFIAQPMLYLNAYDAILHTSYSSYTEKCSLKTQTQTDGSCVGFLPCKHSKMPQQKASSRVLPVRPNRHRTTCITWMAARQTRDAKASGEAPGTCG